VKPLDFMRAEPCREEREMPLKYGIEALTYNDGTRIPLDENSVLVLVGPNNAGKSATLRELRERLTTPARSVVLTNVELRKEGTPNELMAWLEPHRVPLSVVQNAGHIVKFGHGGWDDNSIRSWWPHTSQHIAPWFVHHATTDSRLGVAAQAGLHNRLQQPPSNPLQLLFEDAAAEQRIARAFEQAFRQPLFLDRTIGSTVGLRVGPKPIAENPDEVFSRDYLMKVNQVPLLDSQGDGMRSFVGALLHGIIADWFVVLIDEPEAFLHPPQATLLGKMLVETKPAGRQLLLATHSSDVVRGVLDARGAPVTLVRLDRRGTVNHAKQLVPADVTGLWADPLLRFSNVLDGLFHELVVVCEADADCRFFTAMADATGEKRVDTLFVPSFSKHRLHVVSQSLRSVGVVTRVVADIDLLREEGICRRVFESVGGDWAEVQREWRIVSSAISGRAAPLSLNQVREQVVKAIDDTAGGALTRELAEKIRATVRSVDGWDAVKGAGLAAIPAGDATKAAETLLARFRDKGLFVVPVGEIESFARSVGGHGPPWVTEVLQKDLRHDSELGDARRFVTELLRV
jgi:ABC-type ATPase involved in cell division